MQTVSSTTVRKALKSNSADMQAASALPRAPGEGERLDGRWATSRFSCTQAMANKKRLLLVLLIGWSPAAAVGDQVTSCQTCKQR